MKKPAFLLFLVLCLMACKPFGFAYNAEPNCYKELKTTFFRPNLVYEALSLHNVDQNVWPIINQALQNQSKWVPNLVKQRADRLTPNPLDFPFNTVAARDILLDVLLEIFTQTLHDSKRNANPFNDNDIKGMFRYILTRQRERFEACFGS